MAVIMAGIDHVRADLDVRSVFSFTKKRTAEFYAFLKSVDCVKGAVVISTCNRSELWLSVEDGAEVSPAAVMCSFLGEDEARYEDYFIVRRGREAVDHLFRLTAGLESKILGEDQIITQVGDSLRLARGEYAADHILEVLFRMAITGGKKVKTQTTLSTADSSVIHTAIRTLESDGINVEGEKCLVIGNGMMGKLSALALAARGADVTVTVRQYRSGVVEIPEGCKRINYDERYGLIPECSIVVSATSSPNCTLRKERLQELAPDHRICLVDLAVPRDIDAEAGSLPNYVLYDIDSIHADLQSEKLKKNIELALGILEDQEKEFYTWYEGRDLIPRIQKLKETAGLDVEARLTQAYKGIPLGSEQKQELGKEIEGATQRMMNRMLFGMRSVLPENVFTECIRAMEFALRPVR